MKKGKKRLQVFNMMLAVKCKTILYNQNSCTKFIQALSLPDVFKHAEVLVLAKSVGSSSMSLVL